MPAALRFRLVLLGPAGGRAAWALARSRRPARCARALGATGRGRSSSRPSSRPTEGAVRVIDFMPRRGQGPPRVDADRRGPAGPCSDADGAVAASGLRVDHAVDRAGVGRGRSPRPVPDAFRLSTPLPLRDRGWDGDRGVRRGRGRARAASTLTWHLSYEETPPVEDADSALARTEAWWREWSGRCPYEGAYRDEVLTSLIALKAMTSETTGAVVAAPTTSLPEDIGGVRNWDYRYCWLRDSVLALEALLAAGYTDEALAFRDFLLRVGTGDPTKIQIMYGIGGERRLTEFELPELPGYEGSRPVRVGNAASEQFQLDVYGEVVGGHVHRRRAARHGSSRGCGRAGGRIIEHVETIWREPDDGIWEARGPRRHYTYSKVMAWVVFDRAVRLAERFELEAPARALEADPRRDPRRGLRAGLRPRAPDLHPVLRIQGARRQRPEHPARRASCRATDERVTGTIDAVSRELGRDGFVSRYSTAETDDGLAGDEGQFLACSFWLVSALALNGRVDEARDAVRAAHRAGQRPRPARRGVRRRARAPGRQLPPGVQPPHPDRRGRAISEAEVGPERQPVERRPRQPTRRCAQVPRSARARAVHLQLRRLEHERDDQRHQRGPGHDGHGRAGPRSRCSC